MDIMVDSMGPGAAALLQIDSLANQNDGDLFWQGNQFGQGGNGYNGTGAFTPLQWHRVCAAYNEAANPPVVTKYVDGIFQDDWTANQGLDAERRALLPTAILFGDGDQDERRVMWVNSIQIRSGVKTVGFRPASAHGKGLVSGLASRSDAWTRNLGRRWSGIRCARLLGVSGLQPAG